MSFRVGNSTAATIDPGRVLVLLVVISLSWGVTEAGAFSPPSASTSRPSSPIRRLPPVTEEWARASNQRANEGRNVRGSPARVTEPAQRGSPTLSSPFRPEINLTSALEFSDAPQGQDLGSLLSAEEGARDPAAGPGGSGELGRAERLGEEPEDTRELFLRRQTVLLEPGQWQFDVGLAYTVTNNEVPVALTDQGGDVAGVVGGRIRQRLLSVPFEVRYGLFPRVQMYLNAPLGWSGAELSFPGLDEFSTVGGMGDMRLGTSVLIKKACGYGPQIVGTLDLTFPTGNDSFAQLGLSPGARLGDGFFALGASVLCIHTYDPVVLFYGGGYRHRFNDSSLGFDINPGEQILYEGGVGFAVSDRITLSGALLGAYVTENYVDGVRVYGSILEPMVARFAVTVSNPDRRLTGWRGIIRTQEIVEPFVEIGMTPESPARFGVIWTY